MRDFTSPTGDKTVEQFADEYLADHVEPRQALIHALSDADRHIRWLESRLSAGHVRKWPPVRSDWPFNIPIPVVTLKEYD